MTGSVSRSGLLRGEWTQSDPPLRPPWALAGGAFFDACERCHTCSECISACPPAIVVSGRGGFPEISFDLGACDFCQACVEACPTGALGPAVDAEGRRLTPWNARIEVVLTCIANSGIACRVCEDQCDPRAIRFRPGAIPSMPAIDAGRCTGCGACVGPCPVDAIRVTAAWKEVTA